MILLKLIIPIIIIDQVRSQFVFNQLESDGDSLCDKQLEYIGSNKNELWARRFKDSWGKFPSGLYSGNYYDFGHFDQCINFEYFSENIGHFNGQHCTVLFSYDLKNRERILKGRLSYSTDATIGVSICVPDSCSPRYVKQLANYTLQSSNISISANYPPELFCNRKHSNEIEFTILQKSSIVIFSVFLLFVLLSSVYEVCCNLRNIPKNPVCSSFSVWSNTKSIMSMKPSSPKEMVFLHGLRSIAMIWIILNHVHVLTYRRVPMINANDYFAWVRQFSSMIVFSVPIATDTFFILSSMLLTISVFHELDKTKRINLPMLYIKRYIRITMPLAVAILFVLTFFYYLSNGPLWNLLTSTFLIDLCKENWWTTLLYIGNYASPRKICFGHSWYLMVDMQLYFLSPLILYPLWKLRKYQSIVIPLIFMIASGPVIYVFAMYVKYGFRVSFLSELEGLKNAMIYCATHARADAWMMGILTGYIIYKIDGKTIKLSKSIIITGWMLSIGTILTIIFAQYPLVQINFQDNSIYADAFYDSVCRIFYCLSLTWIIIACQLNHGGIVKKFLSLPIWFPISKLTFCIYLVHVPIQLVRMASIRSPEYFSNFRAIHNLIGDFGIAFFVAFAWALMFEYPTIRILRILTDKRKNVRS